MSIRLWAKVDLPHSHERACSRPGTPFKAGIQLSRSPTQGEVQRITCSGALAGAVVATDSVSSRTVATTVPTGTSPRIRESRLPT